MSNIKSWPQSDSCPDCGGKLEKLEKVEGWKINKGNIKKIIECK